MENCKNYDCNVKEQCKHICELNTQVEKEIPILIKTDNVSFTCKDITFQVEKPLEEETKCQKSVSVSEAKLLPLDGKYYGTEIEYKFGKSNGTLNIWSSHKNVLPSVREKICDCKVECCCGYLDSHYEHEDDYHLALKIVELINNGK